MRAERDLDLTGFDPDDSTTSCPIPAARSSEILTDAWGWPPPSYPAPSPASGVAPLTGRSATCANLQKKYRVLNPMANFGDSSLVARSLQRPPAAW